MMIQKCAFGGWGANKVVEMGDLVGGMGFDGSTVRWLDCSIVRWLDRFLIGPLLSIDWGYLRVRYGVLLSLIILVVKLRIAVWNILIFRKLMPIPNLMP